MFGNHCSLLWLQAGWWLIIPSLGVIFITIWGFQGAVKNPGFLGVSQTFSLWLSIVTNPGNDTQRCKWTFFSFLFGEIGIWIRDLLQAKHMLSCWAQTLSQMAQEKSLLHYMQLLWEKEDFQMLFLLFLGILTADVMAKNMFLILHKAKHRQSSFPTQTFALGIYWCLILAEDEEHWDVPPSSLTCLSLIWNCPILVHLFEVTFFTLCFVFIQVVRRTGIKEEYL